MGLQVAQVEINQLLGELAERVDHAIVDYCDRFLTGPQQLIEAMRYSLEAGGKRIRPALVLLCSDLCNGDTERAMIPAVALEMVHTFSLIHDDLPAMDNDDYRRGKPANHKAFGEAMAILAGDGLLAFSFDLICRHFSGSDRSRALIAAELAEASGPGGMTGGQALDINFQADSRDLEQVEKVHRLKTAALIRCACRLGAICAQADPGKLEALSDYGLKVGLAFQIIDDLLDQTSSQSRLGKRAGKDQARGKPNYAVLAEKAELAAARAKQLIDQAQRCLEPFGSDTKPLQDFAQLILSRKS